MMVAKNQDGYSDENDGAANYDYSYHHLCQH